MLLVLAGCASTATSSTGASQFKGATAQAKDAAAAAATALDESAVKELGVKEGEPVDGGFVFFDGGYIDAPYKVSRRGRYVYINEVAVYQWERWPLPDLRVEEDPGYPPGLTEKSTMDDVLDKANAENGPFFREGRYLDQHFPRDVAKQKFVEWFRGLTFVESAEFRNPGGSILTIKMKDGKQENVSLIPPPRDSVYSWEFTNRDIVRKLESDRGKYEAQVKKGEAVFIFSKGHPVSMIRKRAAEDLGLMAEILRSGRPQQEKINLIMYMQFLGPAITGDKDARMPLFTDFRASKQLEERIGKLAEETGVKPRELKDVAGAELSGLPGRLREAAQKDSSAGDQKPVGSVKK
jgi:hypothetical protein